jgi:hypothetical protein
MKHLEDSIAQVASRCGMPQRMIQKTGQLLTNLRHFGFVPKKSLRQLIAKYLGALYIILTYSWKNRCPYACLTFSSCSGL